jgi:hypothetical protein
MVNMNKWEYKVVSLNLKRGVLSGQYDAEAVESELNKFGQEGWELVRIDGIIIANSVPPVLTFKRPI